MADAPIDYRRLLKKYMRKIQSIEGIDFLALIDYDESPDPITPEELTDLAVIADEVHRELGGL